MTYMTLEIQVMTWDRHKNVAELNLLMSITNNKSEMIWTRINQ